MGEAAAKIHVVRTLLGVLDETEEACEEFQDDSKAWRKLNELAHSFEDRLRGLGMTRLETLGQPFDPRVHRLHSLGTPANTDPAIPPAIVVEELKSGWVLGEAVVRPAVVATTVSCEDIQLSER